MPSFSISGWLPSLTSWATLSRSRMISSTVRLPMIERRWPAKIRPHSSSIRFCSARKRRAALAIEALSSPTLNTATAVTLSGMPWVVTHSSKSSASRRASDRSRAFCLMGRTNEPCPVTMRNCVAPSLCLEPEMSSASSGAGTCQNSIRASQVVGFRERCDVDRTWGSDLDDHHGGVFGDRRVAPRREAFRPAPDGDHDLARPVRRDRDSHPSDTTRQLVGIGVRDVMHQN